MNRNKAVIKFGDQVFECSFGIGFLGELLEHTDLSLQEIGVGIEKNPIKYVPLVMFHSVKYNALRYGKEFTLNLYTFTDLIEANGGVTKPTVVNWLKAFVLSVTPPEINGKPGSDKKKVKPSK